MSDISDIKSGPWHGVLWRWWRDDAVDKAHVLRLLETAEPIPPEANKLLLGLLSGKVKGQRGLKRLAGITQTRSGRREVAHFFATVETMLRDPQSMDRTEADTGEPIFSKDVHDRIRALRMNSEGSIAKRARAETANCYGISERQVRECITESNKAMTKIAKTYGMTLDEFKKATGYAMP